MVEISEAQKEILKETWEIPKKNPIDSGEVIFIRFLEKYPHNKQKFAAFRNVPLLSLKVCIPTLLVDNFKQVLNSHVQMNREMQELGPMPLAS